MINKLIIFLFTCFTVQAVDLTLVGSEELEKFLVDNLKDRRVGYYPNPGNAGDALIWYGTLCLFKKLGISYVPFQDKSKMSDVDVLVYGGGGNLVPDYIHCSNFLERSMKSGKPVVVLSQTIQGHESLLANLKPNVSLICREHMSYEYCKSIVPFPENIHLGFCLAFYSDIASFFKKGIGHLYAFRKDGEVHNSRKKIRLPKDNQDISFSCGRISKRDTEKHMYEVVEKFMKTIASYEVVWTDRLHVGIAAFLLGKKVHLFDNSYGKNRAVFESTIKP